MTHWITALVTRVAMLSVAAAACSSSDASTADEQSLTEGAPDAASAAAVSTKPPRWVTIAPKQCNSNPWAGAKPPSADSTSAIQGEGGEVDHFLRGKGIHADLIGFTRPPEPSVTCAACQCARGDTLLVHLETTEDARRLIAELGFEPLEGNVLSTAPVQCGGNPWQRVEASGEPEQLARWAAQNGAPLVELGFMRHTEHRVACAACQCPRGDLAVVVAKNAAAATKLTALGFERISK
jgi:hypothetical protein